MGWWKALLNALILAQTILQAKSASVLNWEFADRTILMRSKDRPRNHTNISAMFVPGRTQTMLEGSSMNVLLFVDWSEVNTILPKHKLEMVSVDNTTVEIKQCNTTQLSRTDFENFTNTSYTHWNYTRAQNGQVRVYNTTIKAQMVGRTAVLAKLLPQKTYPSYYYYYFSYAVAVQEIGVVRPEGLSSKLFLAIITVMAMINALGRGYKTNYDQVRHFLTNHPTAVIVGVCTQVILMPLISFTICNIFEDQYHSFKLGLLILANTPGSSLGRFFLSHIDADITLHAAINMVSGIVVFGTAPGWILLFGRYYSYEENVLEFVQYLVLGQVINMAIYFVGVGLNQITNEKINKVLKISILITQITFVIAFLSFGLYCNHFWFEPSRSMIYAAAFLQSHLAQLIGISVAVIFKQPICRIKTISLDTGMHNSMLAMTMMHWFLPQPEADLSSMMAFAKLVTTNIFPLLYVLYYKCCTWRLHWRKQVGLQRLKQQDHHGQDQLRSWIDRRMSIRSLRMTKRCPLKVSEYESSL